MAEVDRYRIALYGSSDERPNLKAKIELYRQRGDALSSIGKLRFHEGELPPDETKKGYLCMNLPAGELHTVMAILRNEKPIYFAFHEGRGVFGTGIEPIGTMDTATPRMVHVVEAPPEPKPKLKEPSAPAE